jgi:hypothetical protein
MKSALLGACALFGCSGQPSDLGLDAELSVRSGSFVRSELPAEGAGPGVEAAFLGQTAFAVAQQGKSFNGALGKTATAVAIALEGDVGYWSVTAGPPFVETPTLPSFDAPLSFSKAAAAGPHTLWLAAVDINGHFGPRKPVAFTLTARPVISGTLSFSLYWDRPSDLDLHVILPDGTEVYKDERNSWEPTPGAVEAPNAFETGGRLDLDSNAQCRIDGRNNENVIWTVEPPRGLYTVRVDTFSLCSESAARWSVEARLHGERVALSEGESVGTDTRGAHGAGAGVTAFELQVE